MIFGWKLNPQGWIERYGGLTFVIFDGVFSRIIKWILDFKLNEIHQTGFLVVSLLTYFIFSETL